MAKRATSKPAGTKPTEKRPEEAKPAEAVKEMTAQVRLDVRADTPSYYANFVLVSHTPYDFTLSVAKIPSPPTAEQTEAVKSGGALPVEAMLQIVIPSLLVEGLIKALTIQKELHRKTASLQERNNELQHEHNKPVDSVH